jgi:flagellar basal-body rod protein FlgG
MLEGLFSAAAGMSAQQQQLDAVGTDLANLNTDGYKAQRVAFSDLLYNKVHDAGTETTTGAGASAEIIGSSRAQGALRETGNPLDLAIEGEGYLQVKTGSGKLALTRDGALELNAAGELTTAAGDRLSPPIKVPAGVGAEALRIGSDGTVSANGKKLGRIELVTVIAPDHLLQEGVSLLSPTAASGAVHAASGRLHQGALEDSNVDLGKAMTAMMTTQRAFQMASTAIQSESQMMQIANELRQ